MNSPARLWMVVQAACLCLLGPAAVLPSRSADLGTLTFRVLDDETGEPVPCRIHLRDSQGQPVRAPGLPYWHDHFTCPGEVRLELPTGTYAYEIERGPEYQALRGDARVDGALPAKIVEPIRRMTRLAAEGWYSGDLHVHRPLDEMKLLMRAEDLNIAPVITWWNGRGPWATQPPPDPTIRQVEGHRWLETLAGEDERGGGALLFFGLSLPLPLDNLAREFPPSTRFLRQAKAQPGAWVEIEKLFWWDAPIWLATGLADSVGLCHNHLQRGGMLDNEAWGRPRDRQRYPGPWGNGLYSQDLYYRVLNAGLRLPPSAGSASGVLPNPLGYNRVFVHLDTPLSWKSWWEGLRAGRVFVGNGPLLRAQANGEWPGHVFQSAAPVTLDLQARLDSREPIRAIELVRNGQVETVSLPARFTIRESGWFLLRAIADVDHTFRFASTGPWYVEIEGTRPPGRSDAAEFFLEWTQQRRRAVEAAPLSEATRTEALAPILQAEDYWRSLPR